MLERRRHPGDRLTHAGWSRLVVRTAVVFAGLSEVAQGDRTGVSERPANEYAQVALATDGSLEALNREHFRKLRWINERLSSDLEIQVEESLLDSQASLLDVSAEVQRSASGTQMLPMMMGLGMGRDLMKVCAACVCCLVLIKLLGQCPFGGKRCDCRRCKCCARGLREVGWDEFEGFDVLISVHNVSDIQKDGMMGGKEFKVKISFGWSKWETFATKDCKWEQTKGLEVPQGSSECVLELYSLGKLRDTRLAEYVLETKKDMLDKDDDFWGKKQKIKLESKGKIVGVLAITFRRKEGGDGDGGGGGGGVIPGVDEESALAVELMEAVQELENTPGFVKPPGNKWEGEDKVSLLAKVLCGELREVNEKNGKEKGKTYVRILQCNVAELQGEKMQEQMQKQMQKAKKKGLSAPPKKWYWVWYEDKKTANDKKKWHYPDGFIPMISIMRVSRSPNRNDQFILAYYAEDGKKCTIIYRRETGKGLEVWVEGLDLCYSEARKLVKDQKSKEESAGSAMAKMRQDQKSKEESAGNAMAKMRQLHEQWVQRNGVPRTDEQWTQWFEWFKGKNCEEELIKQLFTEISARSS